MTNAELNRSSRNYGIDLLRIVSMFMIVITHILLHGGMLENASNVWNSRVVWFLRSIVICAVDVYAIISGFVGYSDKEKPYRYSKMLNMWTQVVFYNAGIAIVLRLLGISGISAKSILKLFFPITNGAYWYFTGYFGLFFVIPFFNQIIRKCDRKNLKVLLFTLVLLFIVYPFANSFNGKDTFIYSGGYSFLWLCILYILGALINKLQIYQRIKSITAIIVAIVCVCITWFEKVLFDNGCFMSYISITVVLVAFCLIVIFSKMRFNRLSTGLINFFAPAAFGVYLIHDNNLVRNIFMSNRFVWIAREPVWKIPILVIAFALAILVVCLLIEKLRLWLFKVLRINSLFIFISEKIKKVFDKI